MSDQGIIYVAAGATRFWEECVRSAQSAKRHAPGLPITVFTDLRPRASRSIDQVLPLSASQNPLKHKVASLLASPYATTLFLDTDTELRRSPLEVFAALGTAELGLVNAPEMDWHSRPVRFVSYAHAGRYNTGVIAYRSTAAVRAFFDRWLATMLPHDDATMSVGQDSDQTYFNKLVHTPDGFSGNFTVLDLRFNARSFLLPQLVETGQNAAIVVYHGRPGYAVNRRKLLGGQIRARLRRLLRPTSALA